MIKKFFISFITLFSFASIADAQENDYFEEDKKLKSSFGFTMDNDMFFQTDYYYSAGESIWLINPIISKSPFNRLLVSVLNLGDVVYNGVKIDHKLFTPQDTPNAGLKVGDRPYASSLSLSQFQVIENVDRGYRITSQFSLGVIGEYAFGEQFQSIIHAITPSEAPLGWEYQISNDLLLNYFAKFDKRVYEANYFEWIVSASTNLGTVNNDLALSSTVRTGTLGSFFESYSPKSDSGFSTWLELSYQIKYSAYNAYLEGGMFNKTSPNIIQSDQINRLTQQIGLHLNLQYNSHRVVFDAYRISPEFETSLWHMWGGISYQYWF
ncbi:MAG: lipid A deacylase LpxR family protein [Flavobacteriales bacterium]|nr:lipid A deacylase LpxR family protein [Flavobacteriales bacterium]